MLASSPFLLLALLQPYMEGCPGHSANLASFPVGTMLLGE